MRVVLVAVLVVGWWRLDWLRQFERQVAAGLFLIVLALGFAAGVTYSKGRTR